MTEELKTFEIEKTACVTGHRKIEKEFNLEKLADAFILAIEKGITNFLVGMAVGFDMVCFKVLEKLREIYPIKLIACIPCIDQPKKFSEYEKITYYNLIDRADEKVYVSKEYKKNCMNLRNFYMVDNSKLVIAYLKEEKGGTFNTVSYAKRKGKEIIFV